MHDKRTLCAQMYDELLPRDRLERGIATASRPSVRLQC